MYSEIFTNSVEIPMQYIISDVQKECGIKFKYTERNENQKQPLEVLNKKFEKIIFPVASYTITNLQIDEEFYTDALKNKGQAVKVNNSNKKAITQDEQGVKLRMIPIVFSGILTGYFCSYDEAYSFLMYSLWINRGKEVKYPIIYNGLQTIETAYYILNPVINSPSPIENEAYNGLFAIYLPFSVQSNMAKVSSVQAIYTVSNDLGNKKG